MFYIPRPARRSVWLSGLCGVLLLPLLGIGNAHAAQTTSGFWENDSGTQTYSALTASQIAQFLPDKRGPFQFPAPYNTTGIRVTLPSDCPQGLNCIYYTGYSYYATMNNSAGQPYMWIMADLTANKGGAGPTLYKLDKATNKVTKIGPVFTDSNKVNSGETMYFSHSMPNALYYVSDNKTTLNFINVVTHKETQVFDINGYKSGYHIFACTSSFDDQTHACQLENAQWAKLGCVVYHSNTGKFQAFTFNAGIHSCAMAPGGNYLYTSVNTSPPETVVVDLPSGKEHIIADKDGGSGHHALGYGYMLVNDNWVSQYGATRLWDISNLSIQGKQVFDVPYATACISGSCAAIPAHPSWLNAVPASVQPIAKQYACDSTASTLNVPLGNQVFCYYLDASVAPADQKSLVIAPTMINASKTGCSNGNGYYGNEPKGNIDPTGHYFMWSANLDSNDNCQVFLVKIPISQLPYPPPVVNGPQVSITSPANSASVAGTVTVTAKVNSDVKISSVAWEVDNQKVGSAETAPYAYDLDTDKFALGQHSLTAVATNVDDKTGSATNKIVIVEPSQAPPPPPSQPPPSQPPPQSEKSGGGGSLSIPLLAGLALLAGLGLARKWV